jgi:hypothetical protein
MALLEDGSFNVSELATHVGITLYMQQASD